MSISRVSSVSFGNVYLSKEIKNNIAAGRPGMYDGEVKYDVDYRKKAEKLQSILKTGNPGRRELSIEAEEVGGVYDDGYRWTHGGFGWQEEPVNIPGVMHYYLTLDGERIGELPEKCDATNTLDLLLKALKKINLSSKEKKIIKSEKAERSEELKEKADRKRLQENDKFFKEFLA